MKDEARVFRSLADETRLGMLCLLLQHYELCVCDFVEVLEISQSKASRHLRYLYNAGWVHDRREGSRMKYRLCVPPGVLGKKQLQVLSDVLASHPGARALRGRLSRRLRKQTPARGENEDQTPRGQSGA